MKEIKNYVLPELKKLEDIGNTVEVLNLSFKSLENFLALESLNTEKNLNFVQNLNSMYDKIEYACSFLEKNKDNLLNAYKASAINKTRWLKPIFLFYKEKFYDDNTIFSEEYISDVLCKWIQATYPVKTNDIVNPNYVDGQEAFIFYLKSKENENKTEIHPSQFFNCQTENQDLTVSCSTTVVGRTCIAACGCVDCQKTEVCTSRKTLECSFKDRGLNLKSLNRYLQVDAYYYNIDTYDTEIQNVKLIVKDCVWQINKMLPNEKAKRFLEEKQSIENSVK